MAKVFKEFQVGIDLLGFGKIGGTWVVDESQRQAAWELYIELVTRISVVPLAQDQGLLREALTSLYALFGVTREVLRRNGPTVAAPKRGNVNIAMVAVAMLNHGVRPTLSRWHPLLADWEAKNVPPTKGKGEHERAWEHHEELRGALEDVRKLMLQYADLLEEALDLTDGLIDPGSR